MDNSTKSAGGGGNKNNKPLKNNQNKNNNKAATAAAAAATNGAASSELVAKLKTKEAELEQAQQVIAGLMSKGKGLEKENTKLQSDVKKLKNEIQAMETAMVQMKSTQSLPETDEKNDAAKLQIKALQEQLDSIVKDKIQLKENLELAHKAQMDQAMAKQKSLQQELDKALGAVRAGSAAPPAGGNGVADVWQTKCVATAKQLKDEQKYVKVLEAEKKELEKQLEFASKEKKPWWMCG